MAPGRPAAGDEPWLGCGGGGDAAGAFPEGKARAQVFAWGVLRHVLSRLDRQGEDRKVPKKVRGECGSFGPLVYTSLQGGERENSPLEACDADCITRRPLTPLRRSGLRQGPRSRGDRPVAPTNSHAQ